MRERKVVLLSYVFRAQSEAGSVKLPTPSLKVESIIKDLLCGRVDETAAGFRNIQDDFNAQISRDNVSAMSLKETTNAEVPVDTTMTMSALKTLVSEVRGNAEKVEFTRLKNADTGKDDTRLETIVWTWEREFNSANQEPQVSRVLGLMTPGGNLSSWVETYRSITLDPRDTDDISDWTWQRFRDELFASTMYSSPDKKKLPDTFDSVTCQDPGTPEQITVCFHAFTLVFQDLRRHQLDKQFSIPSQTQMFYKKLLKLVNHHMVFRDPKRKDSELSENLSELQQEV